MKRVFVTLVIAIAVIGLGTAQEKEDFKPSGKASVKIFSNYHTTFTDGNSHSAFEVTRGYFGYGYKFSKSWSGSILFDVGNPGVGGLEMTAYLKDASLKYSHNNLSVAFGLVGTKQFKTQENFWGYRYIYKSFQDQHKYGSSADLGITVAYDLSDFISADFSLLNGEGYKKMENDSIMKIGLGVTLTPVEGLTIRGYTDFMGDSDVQNTVAAFVGYAAKKFSVGAEYNFQKNHKMTEGEDLSGLSIYSTVKVNKVKLFGRYDNASSKDDWNASKDGQLFTVGAEFTPVKGVKIAPNFQGWDPQVDSEDFISSVFLNCEIKF